MNAILAAPGLVLPRAPELVPPHERAQLRTRYTRLSYREDIDEFRARFGKEEGEAKFFRDLKPVDGAFTEDNLLTTVGADLLLKGLVGSAITAFGNANAYIGVGDSSTAEGAGQTDLQAAANKARQAMDATYPTHTAGTNVARFQATFGSGAANYAWNEAGIFNAATAGSMLSRKVSSLGTKTTGSWTLYIDFSLS